MDWSDKPGPTAHLHHRPGHLPPGVCPPGVGEAALPGAGGCRGGADRLSLHRVEAGAARRRRECWEAAPIHPRRVKRTSEPTPAAMKEAMAARIACNCTRESRRDRRQCHTPRPIHCSPSCARPRCASDRVPRRRACSLAYGTHETPSHLPEQHTLPWPQTMPGGDSTGPRGRWRSDRSNRRTRCTGHERRGSSGCLPITGTTKTRAAARQVGVATVVLLRAPPPRFLAAAFPVLAFLSAAILLVALLPTRPRRRRPRPPPQQGQQSTQRATSSSRVPQRRVVVSKLRTRASKQ